LALELDRCGECVAVDDHEIPLLLWAEVAGELDGRPSADARRRESCINKDRLHEFGHRIHVSAARDGASQPGVYAPGVLLLLRLTLANYPVLANCCVKSLPIHCSG